MGIGIKYAGFAGLAGLIFGFVAGDLVRDIAPLRGLNEVYAFTAGLCVRLVTCRLLTATLNRMGPLGLMRGEVAGYWCMAWSSMASFRLLGWMSMRSLAYRMSSFRSSGLMRRVYLNCTSLFAKYLGCDCDA